jgi:ribosomal protein S8
MSVNFIIGDFISQWRVANLTRVKFATFHLNVRSILPIIHILYSNGVIRSYKYLGNNSVKVYFKYYQNILSAYKLNIISTPGHRVYWTLKELSNHFNQHHICGFYIISTKYGLKTSTDCLLHSHIGGEVLLKVEI